MEHLFEQETEDKGLKEDEMYPQAAVIDKKDLSQDDVLDDNPPQKKMKFINKSAVISEDPRYQGKKVTLKEIEDQTETIPDREDLEEDDIESVEDNADIESLDNSNDDFDSKIQQCKKHMEQTEIEDDEEIDSDEFGADLEEFKTAKKEKSECSDDDYESDDNPMDLQMSDDSDEEIDSDEFGEDEEEVQFKKKKASRSNQRKSIMNQKAAEKSLKKFRIRLQPTLTEANMMPRVGKFEQIENSCFTDSTDIDLGEKADKIKSLLLKIQAKSSSKDTDLSNESSMDKRVVLVKQHRGKYLKYWYDRTNVGGKKSNFGGMEKSTNDQVEEILMDRERLIKRTQMKRSKSHVMCESDEQDSDEGFSSNVNPETFDDEDFYGTMLKEIIQEANQPRDLISNDKCIQMTRDYLARQGGRKRARKAEYDRRASKGRKLRYEIHPKLENFMACTSVTWGDARKNKFFKNIFA